MRKYVRIEMTLSTVDPIPDKELLEIANKAIDNTDLDIEHGSVQIVDDDDSPAPPPPIPIPPDEWEVAK